MPYIPQDRRKDFQRDIASLVAEIKTEGELTFVLYAICVGLWRIHQRYVSINHITGSLLDAWHEFKVRISDPYECSARERNGDV